MQSPQDIQIADARLNLFAGKRTVVRGGIVAALAAVTVIAAYLIHMTAFVLTSESGVRTLNMDFRVFWAAARLALQGEALSVFDMVRLGAEHNVNPDAWMPWLYPPGYLLLIAAFGTMSFAAAFLVSNLISLGLLAWALRPFTTGAPGVWLAMVLAPAYIPSLILGQNSLIWLAGLLGALAALRGERWILAGVFIGCLTLKPQLGLMIPFALLAAGLWRTILAASVTAILLAVLPTLVLGMEYWPLFAERLAEQSERLLVSIPDLFLMVGPFYLFTVIGLPPTTAIAAQWGITALSAVFVFVLWRNRRAGFDAKAAGLLIAILLSAPYLWYYEVAAMAVIGLFLLRAGALGQTPPQLLLLLLLWCGAALQSVNIFLDFADGRLLGALIITPVLLASLVMLLRHLPSKVGTPAAPEVQ